MIKKLLLILSCLPFISLAQQTYVPDDNFENYLEANGMGDGIALNDNVFTSAIDTVAYLDVSNQNISDLTGIEDFIALTILSCGNNQFTSLDVIQNTSLTYLECQVNQLTSLDISQNTALLYLYTRNNLLTNLDISNNISLIDLECHYNQITSLNVGNNTSLTDLDCSYNQLTSLDISNNTDLHALWCQENQLTILDLRNGNNTNFTSFNLQTNPNLFCINVDNAIWSTANWTVANGNIDFQHYFSDDCSATGIEEHPAKKELLRKIDVLGRETEGKKKEPLFYIYDDGTVEKQIIIE
mgnify:FL=1